MTDEEFTVGLRAFSRRQPFRPYLIEFVSGQQIPVRHPEGVAPFGRVWLFRGSAGAVVFSSSSVCRLVHDSAMAAGVSESAQS